MDHEGFSDWEWVQRVQGGDADAFEVLVHRHEKMIFNLLYRWIGDYDEASEAAQQVFLSAYRSIKQFRGDSSFSSWLYRIGINQAKNHRKSWMNAQQRVVPLEVSDPEGDGGPAATLQNPGLDPAQEVEQQEIHDRVQQALNSLKREDALIILLHDFQELAYEEIAQVMGLPIGTVKSRLHRARQALKTKLTPYYQSMKTEK